MCVCMGGGRVFEVVGGLYSLWCHLRKVLGPVKPSEWMECFFRRPRSTFFHRGTSVCLFLFQIHSIIPDCSKHSRSPTFLFPLQPGSPTTTLLPTLTPAPTHTGFSSFFFFPSFLITDGRGPRKDPLYSLFSPCWGIWVTLDEGKPSYFRNTWLVHCAAIKENEWKQTRCSSCGTEGSTSLFVWYDWTHDEIADVLCDTDMPDYTGARSTFKLLALRHIHKPHLPQEIKWRNGIEMDVYKWKRLRCFSFSYLRKFGANVTFDKSLSVFTGNRWDRKGCTDMMCTKIYI